MTRDTKVPRCLSLHACYCAGLLVPVYVRLPPLYAIVAAGRLRGADGNCPVSPAGVSVLISVTTGMLRRVMDAGKK